MIFAILCLRKPEIIEVSRSNSVGRNRLRSPGGAFVGCFLNGSDSDNPKMTEEGIRLCGHHMKEEELNEIFLALDADGTGGGGGWKRMSFSAVSVGDGPTITEPPLGEWISTGQCCRLFGDVHHCSPG